MNLHNAINQLFELVQLILIVRILLSWFPNINWWKQPFKFLHEATEPILEPFRRLIPPISGLDLSPLVAFLCLNLLQSIILSIL